MPFVSVLSADWAASNLKLGDTALSSPAPLLMGSLLGDTGPERPHDVGQLFVAVSSSLQSQAPGDPCLGAL